MGEDLLTYWLLIYEMNGFGLILQALKFMVQLEPLNLHRARVFFSLWFTATSPAPRQCLAQSGGAVLSVILVASPVAEPEVQGALAP